ncbi:phage tail tape measure protein [Clostridium thermarum]|uniref:phage tail tape measure protein n=1 Tax=Clostridium thermarum TaxID=1716543 RepID=UPI0011236317|nr:phage tail tape measure protein [Clostridium thermarum]
MASKIGAQIALEGEREFKKAISEINTGLKVTASELTLVTARFSDNSKSVEGLTAKNTVLQKQLYEQAQKVGMLRAALDNAAESYGEADARTLKWQVSLNNAEAELIKMQKELDKSEQELKKFSEAQEESAEKGRSLGDVLNSLISALGVNLPDSAQNAISALDGQKVSTLALIGATAGLVTGLSKATIETAKHAKEIQNVSQTSGMSIESYQEWDYVLSNFGHSMEQASGDLANFAEKIMDAANGTGEGAEMFGKLGIKVTENNGKLKTQEKLFDEVITKLQSMKNETERNAIASALLSTTGEKLIPILNMTGQEVDALKQKAHDMGYVMDSEVVKSFSKLDDSLKIFDKQKEAFKNSVAEVMLPVLTGLFEMLNKIDPKILATVAIIGSVAVVAVTVAKAIGDVTNTFSAMNPATLKTTAIIVGVTTALIALAAIIAVIVGKGDELNNTMANIGTSVGNMTSTVNNAGSKIGRNATGTSNWRGGWTWVGEEGPELIEAPAGAKIYSNKRSMQMLAGAEQESGGDTFIFNVKMEEISEVSKLLNVIKQVKQTRRAGVVKP